MTKHFPLAPSSGYRWTECGKSLAPSPRGDRGGEAADEGTRAHDALYHWLVEGVEPTDEDFYANLKPFVDYVRPIIAQAAVWQAEETIQDLLVPEHGGTSDFAALSLCGEEAWVVDLKYGFGEVVARENKQLLSYASLWSQRWRHVKTWRLVIVQPRTAGPPVDEWEATAEEVAEHHELVARSATAEHRASHKTGPHCTHCPHAATCEPLYQLAVKTAEEDFAAFDETDRVGHWMRLAELKSALVGACDAAEKALADYLWRGGDAPGWKLVEGRKHRRWKLGQEELLAKFKSLRIPKKDVTKVSVLTPNQVEAAGYTEKVAELWEKPDGGPELVRESDKRPPYVRDDPNDDFKDVA